MLFATKDKKLLEELAKENCSHLTPEEFNEVQAPLDEHSEWWKTDWDKIGKYHNRLLQDEYGAKYSWTAVLALILSNFHYLHE